MAFEWKHQIYRHPNGIIGLIGILFGLPDYWLPNGNAEIGRHLNGNIGLNGGIQLRSPYCWFSNGNFIIIIIIYQNFSRVLLVPGGSRLSTT